MAENTDNLNGSAVPLPPPAPPHATGESHASSAHGAPAPLDGAVVHVDFQSGVRIAGEARPAPDLAQRPPSPKKGAAARDSGDGGGKSPAADQPVQGRKKEKTIDWGRFNHLIENFALIYGTDTVWDGSERLIMKIANMGHAHGADMVRMWKASEKRRTVRLEDVVFDPTLQADPASTVNLFDGMAMVPKEGDVQPMLELVSFLTSRATPDEGDTGDIMHWLLCWLAYPLQHPGTKLRTAVVMHGDEGAGKNFLFDIMVAIYGKYGALVGQDELEDKHNDWRSCKLFVVGDEVSSRAELVHNKNRLKALITSPTVQINPKHLTRREEKNHMNIVFLSNELQPLALDNSDRRYLVVYTPRAKGFEYYKALGDWRDSGGVEAFYHYLLNYPLGDFHPFAPAPMTEAKSALIAINRKSPELFWSEWQAGELDLPYHSCAITQAYAAYLKWCQRTGDRYPFPQTRFTPTVVRFAEGQGCPVRTKPMNVTRPGQAKKTERMFLVTEPILGEGAQRMTEGDWATSAVRDFADALRKYSGYGSGAPAPNEQEPQGGQ
ncbi:primase-helicase family protein [Delftia sp.]|uniref:primase-helicase family protein n=1 Tax=Delftia sp. TaxID=1886637 RepID=UPI00259CC469|nr:primase-helicase family protein [Delftia sp.]